MRAELVGRVRELERASAVLDSDASAVVVGGPAGVGKTRLLNEVVARAESTGWPVVRLFGSPAVREIPLGAVSHLLIGEPGGDPAASFHRARAELRRSAPDGRLLLAVDDGHELDDGSAAFVRQVLLHSEARVILTARAESAPPPALTNIWKADEAHRLDLDPLDRSDSDRLVEALLGGPADLHLRGEVWRIAQGHPLYVTVALAAAVETGDVRVEAGSWRATGVLSSGRLAELVLARTRDLAPDDRRALRVVAFAAPVREDDVLRVVGADAIAQGLDRGLVVRREVDGEPVVSTEHPLFAEVLNRQLPTDVRREIAGGLAAAVAARGARTKLDRLRAAMWSLESGGQLDPELATAGAEVALGRGDYALAERLGRAAADQHPSMARARIVLGRALAFQGRPDEAETVLSETEGHSPDERVEVALARGHNFAFVLGRPDRAVAVLTAAATELRDEHRWQLDADRALYGAVAGDFSAAFEAAGAALANPGTPDVARLTAHVNLALARAMTARLEEFDEGVEEALLLASDRDELPLVSEQVISTRASAWCTVGRIDEAVQLTRAAVARSGPGEAPSPLVESWLSLALGFRGELRESVDASERALAGYESADPFRLRPQAVGLVLLARAQAGDLPGDARTRLESAEALAGTETRLSVWLGRARAWMEAVSGDILHAVEVATDTGRRAIHRDHVAWGVLALHDAVRFGATGSVVDDIGAALASTSGADLLEVMRDHAVALADDDGQALDRVAGRFFTIGAGLLGAESAAQASVVLLAEGDEIAAHRAATRAAVVQWASRSASPALVSLPIVLTDRELEIAVQAAQGRRSRAIADDLYVSIRTVDNHLQRIYRKLGVSRRFGLGDVLAPALR